MPHVLLVDDDPAQASVYAQLLARHGVTSERAAGVQDAVTALGERLPHAILVDLGLPDLGGVELIRAVRAREGGRSVRVLVLANAYLELEALAAWEAGADQVVGKSTRAPEEILEFVLAEVGGAASPGAAAGAAADPALAEFLERASGYVRTARDRIASVRPGSVPAGAIEDVATAMRRLQASQAFGLAGLPQLAAVAEWLARALHAWPSSVGASALRTLGQALDAIEARAAAPQTPLRDLTRCRVLAVDDDATSRLLVQQAFRKVRVPCDLAASGEAALAAAQTTRYDLVVTDVLMPGIDGFELAARLRASDAHAATPVLFVTGADGFDEAFARDARGGADAIVKPYLIMELATKAVVHLLRPLT